MNIFTKYTLQNLKKNRTRTLITIVGIILSVAMFTAVTESLYSGQQFMIESVKATTGSFDAQFIGMDAKTLEALKTDKDFTNIATLQDIGFAQIDSANEYMPYIHIGGMSENFSDLVPLHLIEGRMPEKADELLISRHMYTNGRVNVGVGDTLTLNVGTREYDGEKLFDMSSYKGNDEKLVDVKQRTYTVVGVCARPDRLVERHEEPGYSAFTLPEEDETLRYAVYFTLKDAGDLFDWDFSRAAQEKYGYITRENSDLLMFEAKDKGSSFYTLVIGLGTVLILIIMAGSIALIYNSFSISVTERTKQYGLLRSVGATKKQMKRSVLTEALILCVFGVPLGLLAGCGGIAVTFRALAPQFAVLAGSMYDMTETVSIKMIPNAPALIAAALIGVITVVLSALIPIRRSMKLSAIEAIRMSGDITENGVKEKTGKLTYKLFGFEGMLAKKNFARNKKKYRTTVVSLAMSLVLFISASSLCFYFKKSFDMGVDYITYDVSAYVDCAGGETEQAKETLSILANTDGVDEAVYMVTGASDFLISSDELSEDGKRQLTDGEEGSLAGISVGFIEDEAFRELCRLNGVSPEAYFGGEKPMGLLFDNMSVYETVDGKSTYHTFSVLKSDTFPYDLPSFSAIYSDPAGYLSGMTEKGEAQFYNYEEDRYYTVPFDEAFEKLTLSVGKKITELPFYLSPNGYCLYYPEARVTEVLGGAPEELTYYGFYKAADHAAVYEKMLADTIDRAGVQISDNASDDESTKALITLISVFSYGFITLISLIAAANVFNTVSTNIMLRRRELAMLKSVGMSPKGFRRMTNFESLLYGFKSLAIGLPVSFAVTFVIYYVVGYSGFDMSFSLPWTQILIAVVSVFAVVFASMIYSMNKIKKYNTADELKNENL